MVNASWPITRLITCATDRKAAFKVSGEVSGRPSPRQPGASAVTTYRAHRKRRLSCGRQRCRPSPVSVWPRSSRRSSPSRPSLVKVAGEGHDPRKDTDRGRKHGRPRMWTRCRVRGGPRVADEGRRRGGPRGADEGDGRGGQERCPVLPAPLNF